MTDWPTDLPRCFTLNSYEEDGANNVLRTENSIGPAKARRRSTSNVWTQSGQMVMTATQYQTFLDFVANDIKDGATAFLFPDRLGGSPLAVRMTTPHKANRVGTKWYVSIALEVLP